MNILVAQKVDGAYKKIGVFIPNEQFISNPAGDFLATMAYQYFKDEPSAVSINVFHYGIEYRVSKF
jgi:hypothetical protein